MVAAPQGHSDFGHAHWHAWVAGIGLLDSVHCQCADRIGHFGEGERRFHRGDSKKRLEFCCTAAAAATEPNILPERDMSA
jgi:hypothetical protein